MTVLVLGAVNSSYAQGEPKTYIETRKLLAKLDRSNYENGALPELFRKADSVKADLERALYDNDQKISLNAQVIIKYVAESRLLEALGRWIESRKVSPGTYWLAPINLTEDKQYLDGRGDLPERVLQTLYPKEKDMWAKTVATNKNLDTVLIEVVSGNVFTTGWHVVVRKDGERWQIISHSLVWQS